MADGYQLAGRIVPSRTAVAALGVPGPTATWAFAALAEELGRATPDPRFLKILRISKERFLKPARMTPGGLALANTVIALAAVAAIVGLWRLLTPHGTALFILGGVTFGLLGIYAASEKTYAKPFAIAGFDVIIPFLLAIPLLGAAALQLVAGKLWRSLGSAQRLGPR
jgi:hypothetical protein